MKILTAVTFGYLAGAGTVLGVVGGWALARPQPDWPKGRRAGILERRPDSPSERLVFGQFLNRKLWTTDGPLWARLGRGCSPAALAKLVDTVSRRDLAIAEARRGDCPKGVSPASYIADLRERAISDIQATMGPTVADMVQKYEDTSPQRQLVDEANRILISEDCPLTATQTEIMVNLLKANAEPLRLTTKSDEIEDFIGRRRKIFDYVAQAAAPAMTAGQLAVFRREFQMQIAYWEYFKMRQEEADDLTRETHD